MYIVLLLIRCKQSGDLATCSGDDTLHIFQEGSMDSSSIKPAFNLSACTTCAHDEDVNSVRWNPDGSNILASAGDDGVVKLWKYIQH